MSHFKKFTLFQSKNLLSKSSFNKRAQSSYNLTKKIALITGGVEGIGLAISKSLLKQGLKAIAIADVNEGNTDSIQELTRKFGKDKIYCAECDVNDSKQLDWTFKNTIKKYHGLDIVINNAGVMNDIGWETEISTNLYGCVVGTLLGMQYMSKTCSGKGGLIINMASIMGLTPSAGFPIHTLTQFGIVGFSRAMGGGTHYQRTGVKVIALCPGLTETKLIRQAPYYALNDKFCKEFREETSGCTPQKAECVGEAILDVLESQSGATWVIENGERPFVVDFPYYREEETRKIVERK